MQHRLHKLIVVRLVQCGGYDGAAEHAAPEPRHHLLYVHAHARRGLRRQHRRGGAFVVSAPVRSGGHEDLRGYVRQHGLKKCALLAAVGEQAEHEQRKAHADQSGCAPGVRAHTVAERASQRALWRALWRRGGWIVIGIVIGAIGRGRGRLARRRLQHWMLDGGQSEE